MNNKVKDKKTASKKAGLKATFVLNENELLMTSYGRGNDSKIERVIDRSDSKNPNLNKYVSDDNEFSVEKYKRNKYRIQSYRRKDDEGKFLTGRPDDPLVFPEYGREDQIGCRKQLEARYFKNSENIKDNIHIQLIYNILDIDKILSMHMSNIIYILDKLAKLPDDKDFVGNISLREPTYEKFIDSNKKYKKEYFNNFINNDRLLYFKDVFFDTKEDENGDISYERKSEEYIYNLLITIGELRQYLFHADKGTRGILWNKDSFLYTNHDIKKMLDDTYKKGINGIDKGFIENNSSFKFAAILKIYDISKEKIEKYVENKGKIKGDNLSEVDKVKFQEGKAEFEKAVKIIKDFYEFAIKKTYIDSEKKERTNFGFSIKNIREQLLKLEESKDFNDFFFDGIEMGPEDSHYERAKRQRDFRSKLYNLIDFIIYEYYKNNEQIVDKIVYDLRSVGKNEEAKNKIYTNEAKKLWYKKSSSFTRALDLSKDYLDSISNNKKGKYEIGKELKKELKVRMEEVYVSNNSDQFSSITKVVYLLTRFLDGKEINDLLTILLNKCESVDSLISVMESQGINVEFKDEFELIKNSGEIANEIRITNTFARMVKGSLKEEEISLIDALTVLRCDDPENAKNILNYDKYLQYKNKRNEPELNFFRFIKNSVVNSRRFRYVMKYCDAYEAKKIGSNKEIIELVLNEINKIQGDQIRKYYMSIFEAKSVVSDKEMIVRLRERLINMQFNTIKNGYGSKDSNEITIKLVGLYLTIIYLAIKNLVYINSRYTLAFHCLFRDANLLEEQRINDETNLPELKKSGEPIIDFKYSNLAVKVQLEKSKKVEEELKALEEEPWKKGKIERKKNQKDNCKYMKTNLDNLNDHFRILYRNAVDHLNVVRQLGTYSDGCLKMGSYYELYHYILQKYLFEKCGNELSECGKKAEEYKEEFENGICTEKNKKRYCLDMVKALNAPFQYNYARFKSLSIEDLFDKNRPKEEIIIKPEEKEIEIIEDIKEIAKKSTQRFPSNEKETVDKEYLLTIEKIENNNVIGTFVNSREKGEFKIPKETSQNLNIGGVIKVKIEYFDRKYGKVRNKNKLYVGRVL